MREASFSHERGYNCADPSFDGAVSIDLSVRNLVVHKHAEIII